MGARDRRVVSAVAPFVTGYSVQRNAKELFLFSLSGICYE